MGEIARTTTKKPEAKSEKSVSQKRQNELSQSINSPVEHILYLQRTIGNQAVERLIKSGALQAKLSIGQPGDKYEQEADRVADAVMRIPEPGVQRQVEPEEEEEEFLQAKPLAEEITPLVQRQVEPEEEEEEEMLQAKSREDATSEVPNDLESQINAIKSGGQPLVKSELAFFEPRFGRDFSQVRVHTDAQAAEAARGANARAFTMGRDVAFGTGQYAPGASEGRRLLAHELTHVVQRGLDSSSNKIQRVVEDDITQMRITKDWAINLNDAELEEQINIVRDQLLTLDPTTPEYTAARQNLRILEAEATLRLVTQPKASSADFIISSNAANIVDIGTHVMYTVEQKSQTLTVGTSYRFSWYLYNDKKAYEDLKIISKICSACNVKVPRVPMEIKGPINSKIWKLIAVYPGVHRIVAIISLKGVSLTELEFKQHVSGINWKDVEILILKKIDNHIKLYPELTTFQNQLNKIAKEIFTKYSNPSDLPPKEKAGLWALSQLDVKEWTKSATSPGRGTKEIGEGYKCNKFIADAFGFGAGLGYGTPKGYPTNEHTRFWGIYKAIYPPVANNLADPTKNINNFPVIAYKDHTAKPPQNIPANKLEFGDVIAFYTPGGIGHTGIYLGDGLYIAAGETRGGYIEPVSNQEPPLHNHKYTTYRRYTPP